MDVLGWLRVRELGPETYLLTRRLFLTLLGLCYGSAFVSLWVQLPGLLGSHGLEPALDRLAEQSAAGAGRFWRLPTLLWLWPSDCGLHVLCAAGSVCALLLVAGIAPRLTAAALWLLYLSLVSVGGVFLPYQWDTLLLETGLLAILFAPGRLAPRAAAAQPVEPLALALLRFLLFKLMFLSGALKWLSGDPTWRGLSATTFHYLTQPLPLPISWYADRLPGAFHTFEAGATLAIELGLPWLIFAPRRLRWLAWAGLSGLQLLIASTGNYGFFNLLSLSLCVLLLDDASLRRLLPARLRPPLPDPARARRTGWPRRRVALALVAALLFTASATRLLGVLGLQPSWLAPIAALNRTLAPLLSNNGYGLFAVMTTERDEIELEGSDDGRSWRAYRFRWKPGPLERAPAFAGPHMPRLDWQMWFAALQGCARVPWFHVFLLRVLEGDPAVLDLLAENPFGQKPPRYLRTPLYRYRFATPDEGGWWRRRSVGVFCPTVELRQGRLVEARRP